MGDFGLFSKVTGQFEWFT